MRLLVLTAILLAAVALCGCTSVTTPDTPPLPPFPNLVGNWSGPMTGYDQGPGYTNYSGSIMVMTVKEQKDRIFSGMIDFVPPIGNHPAKEFAGVIDRDGRTIRLAEEVGYSTGTVLSKDEIEIVYSKDGTPFTVAIDSLKRNP